MRNQHGIPRCCLKSPAPHTRIAAVAAAPEARVGGWGGGRGINLEFCAVASTVPPPWAAALRRGAARWMHEINKEGLRSPAPHTNSGKVRNQHGIPRCCLQSPAPHTRIATVVAAPEARVGGGGEGVASTWNSVLLPLPPPPLTPTNQQRPTGNRRFLESGRPRATGNPSKKVGGEVHLFVRFPGRPGPPRTPTSA